MGFDLAKLKCGGRKYTKYIEDRANRARLLIQRPIKNVMFIHISRFVLVSQNPTGNLRRVREVNQTCRLGFFHYLAAGQRTMATVNAFNNDTDADLNESFRHLLSVLSTGIRTAP